MRYNSWSINGLPFFLDIFLSDLREGHINVFASNIIEWLFFITIYAVKIFVINVLKSFYM